MRSSNRGEDLKPDNILVGIEDHGVLQEMIESEEKAPLPYIERGDRRIYGHRNFRKYERAPGEPKISDFGNAVLSPGPHFHPIQPNLFQAPEVILEAGWSFSADIWNLGVMVCVFGGTFHSITLTVLDLGPLRRSRLVPSE